MVNIFLNYFKKVYSPETYLFDINFSCPLGSEDQFKKTLNHLSTVKITFDFSFKGGYLSCVHKRFTYEQILLLCFLKVNENREKFANHMLLARVNERAQVSVADLKMEPKEMERKLLALENLSISYFLSGDSYDGMHWRRLYSYVGSSIMKHLLLYSLMFRRINDYQNTHIQICGIKFNTIQRALVNKSLRAEETRIKHPDETTEMMNESEDSKSRYLKHVFVERDRELMERVLQKKSPTFQLNKLGHSCIDKTSMLYSRNLKNNINSIYIYSDRKLTDQSSIAKRILNEFIFKNLNFDNYSHDHIHLTRMRSELLTFLTEFVHRHRLCPYDKLIRVYCYRATPRPEASLQDKVEPKKVFAFLRRCLMFTLGVELKRADRWGYGGGAGLLGGQKNFECLMKKVYKVVTGLKYDTFMLNHFLHGMKFARIELQCDRYKRLVLMGVVRWLLEDYCFVLIKSRFYVTDTTSTNSEMFFYLKDDWSRIVRRQLKDPAAEPFRKEYNLSRIAYWKAVSYCANDQSHGVFLGRLLPKNINNECRIISGSRVNNPSTKTSFNGNFRYITLNNSLKWLIRSDPKLVGFACSGHHDIQNKYRNFLSLNAFNRSYTPDQPNGPFKKWNFLKIDIKKCFDNVQIKDLISYINELFITRIGRKNAFTMLRYCTLQLDVDRKQLKIRYDCHVLKHACSEKGYKYGIADFIKCLEKETGLDCGLLESGDGGEERMERVECVIVPQLIHDRNVTVGKLQSSLRACLEHVMIKIHNDIFERMDGILQGSVCSRNLCDLYLGRIENKLFSIDDPSSLTNAPTTDNPSLKAESTNPNRMQLSLADELILRVVDDYLVISAHLERMNQISLLLRSQLRLNEKKSENCPWTMCSSEGPAESTCIMDTNSDMTVTTQATVNCDANVKPVMKEMHFLHNYSNKMFSWCGFDFDMYTLDVYFNYEKYFIEGNLLNRLNHTGDYVMAFAQFNLKFLRLFDQNSSRVVIDNRINHVQAVVRNFVDFFALSAIRFIIYTKIMPSQFHQNANLQMKLIMNQCHRSTSKVSSTLTEVLLYYFHSTFNLFKFICLRVYSVLLGNFAQAKSSHFLVLVKKYLKELDFENGCHRQNHFKQLNDMIDQQLDKFFHVKL